MRSDSLFLAEKFYSEAMKIRDKDPEVLLEMGILSMKYAARKMKPRSQLTIEERKMLVNDY